MTLLQKYFYWLSIYYHYIFLLLLVQYNLAKVKEAYNSGILFLLLKQD